MLDTDPPAAVLRASLEDAADLPAICVDQGRTVTYRELLAMVEAHAATIEDLHLPSRCAIAVVGRPGLGLYVGLLGAILSGGVPAPIDAAVPVERIRGTLRLVRPGVVVWTPDTERIRHAVSVSTATVEVDRWGRVARASRGPAWAGTEYRAGVGYLGFTSGSRGTPKAIVGSARGLLRFLAWQRDRFGVAPGARFGQLTSPGFDVFYRDLLTPLCAGATVCVPGTGQLAGAGVLDWLAQAGVTHLHAVPSLVRYWLRAGRGGRSPVVTMSFFAGEPLPGDLATAWRTATGGGRVINLYGAAEATLAQTCYEVPVDCGTAVQPVGTPLPGNEVRIVDADGRNCAPGVAGEVVVRSPHLSYGYLSAEGEDAPTAPLSRYRTGDRGVWSRSRELHLVGRIDREVKIRGVRVNLDEVAAVLATHESVGSAVVVTGRDRLGELVLRAHVTGAATAAPAELRRHLAAVLPEQMVPATFQVHATLPLGPTGKVSARAVESAETGGATCQVAPTGER